MKFFLNIIIVLLLSTSVILAEYTKGYSDDTFDFTIDKQKHFVAGVIIYNITKMSSNNSSLSFAATVSIAGIKEAYDEYSGKGTPSFQDIFYTILPAFVQYTTEDFLIKIKKNKLVVQYQYVF